MVGRAYNASNQEAEAGGLFNIGGQPELYNEFQASLGWICMRLSQKQTNQTKTKQSQKKINYLLIPLGENNNTTTNLKQTLLNTDQDDRYRAGPYPGFPENDQEFHQSGAYKGKTHKVMYFLPSPNLGTQTSGHTFHLYISHLHVIMHICYKKSFSQWLPAHWGVASYNLCQCRASV